MLKVGDVIKIYQDPITKRDYEGLARLCKLVIGDNESQSLSLWSIQFLNVEDSDCTFQRWILEGD